MGARPARAYLAPVNRENLTLLSEMLTAGTLHPVIDRTYPFDQIPEAVRYVEEGRARGKVVIRVA